MGKTVFERGLSDCSNDAFAVPDGQAADHGEPSAGSGTKMRTWNDHAFQYALTFAGRYL